MDLQFRYFRVCSTRYSVLEVLDELQASICLASTREARKDNELIQTSVRSYQLEAAGRNYWHCRDSGTSTAFERSTLLTAQRRDRLSGSRRKRECADGGNTRQHDCGGGGFERAIVASRVDVAERRTRYSVASLSTVHVITSCMHQLPEINCNECKIHEQQPEVL